MVDQQIVDYINQHKQNHSTDALRKALIAQGHSTADVDEAMRIATGGSGGSHKKLMVVIAVILIVIFSLPYILSFVAWTYLDSYWRETVEMNIQIMDSYCAGGGDATIIVNNRGVGGISTSDIKVIDVETGKELDPGTDYSWTVEGSVITEIEEGETALLELECGTGMECNYRLEFGGRTISTRVVC